MLASEKSLQEQHPSSKYVHAQASVYVDATSENNALQSA